MLMGSPLATGLLCDRTVDPTPPPPPPAPPGSLGSLPFAAAPRRGHRHPSSRCFCHARSRQLRSIGLSHGCGCAPLGAAVSAPRVLHCGCWIRLLKALVLLTLVAPASPPSACAIRCSPAADPRGLAFVHANHSAAPRSARVSRKLCLGDPGQRTAHSLTCDSRSPA